MVKKFLPFEVEVQERLLAFFQFANSVTFKGHLRVLRKNSGLLSEKPHKVLGGWSRQLSQERGELHLQFQTEDLNFVYQ